MDRQVAQPGPLLFSPCVVACCMPNPFVGDPRNESHFVVSPIPRLAIPVRVCFSLSLCVYLENLSLVNCRWLATNLQ
jgi:hypothetical protein